MTVEKKFTTLTLIPNYDFRMLYNEPNHGSLSLGCHIKTRCPFILTNRVIGLIT